MLYVTGQLPKKAKAGDTVLLYGAKKVTDSVPYNLIQCDAKDSFMRSLIVGQHITEGVKVDMDLQALEPFWQWQGYKIRRL